MASDDWAVAVLRWFSTTLPVVLVAVVIAPFIVDGGTLLPWRPQMPELGTMIQFATQMVDGQVVFDTVTFANFPYTPFAALLMAPLGLSGEMLWQLLLIVASVSALQHILSRLLGLADHQLVLVGSLVVLMVEPVRLTLGVGQVSLLVMLLVVVDLIEPVGRTRQRRRLLPQGSLTGIAGGIALTPLWILLVMLVAGRRRVALTGLAAALGCFVLGWIVMPGQSERLLDRSSRSTYGDALWASNQSLLAAMARLGSPEILAQVLALAVAIAGVWAAAHWWRDEPVFALGLVMFAALMPRDPAWTWQFVGVLVVAAGLLRALGRLPLAVLAIGGSSVVWTSLALPQLVGSSNPVPSVTEAVMGSIGPALVVLLVGAAVFTAPRRGEGHTPVNSGRTANST